MREKESLVKEKIKFLESEIGNNAEYEKRISVADRKVLKCRTEYQQHETNRNHLKDEVHQLKRLVCVFMTDYYKNKHGFPFSNCLLVLFVLSLLVMNFQDSLIEPLIGEGSNVCVCVWGGVPFTSQVI